jgi:hypothetical protein
MSPTSVLGKPRSFLCLFAEDDKPMMSRTNRIKYLIKYCWESGKVRDLWLAGEVKRLKKQYVQVQFSNASGMML